MSAGGLDPVARRDISGWSFAGDVVSVLIDGQLLGSAPAARLRQFVVRRPPDPRCGFALPAPEKLFDGAPHEIQAVSSQGHELEGSPLRFRQAAVQGRVEAFRDGLLFGRLACSPLLPDLPVLAAIMGDETIAHAVARPAPGSREDALRFSLALPAAALRAGPGLVHVALAGSGKFLDGGPIRVPGIPSAGLLLRERQPPVTAAIKISAPSLRVAEEWGDYHFARALAAALERRGWVVRVDCIDEWERSGDEVVLCLRGRQPFPVDPSALNLLWVISHPDRLDRHELSAYAHVFVASEAYAAEIGPFAGTSVGVLHQCTDPSVFFPPARDPLKEGTVIFVGNSRREYRTMARWCVEEGIDVSVFGTLWEGLIPDRLIRGRHVANARLHEWYGACGIVLNDHWETMRAKGFLSNRLFDASAAGGFVISDPIPGLGEVFGDSIETAGSAEELRRKVERYLRHPEEAAAKARSARAIVLAKHTFDHRADVVIRVANREGRTAAGLDGTGWTGPTG